MNPRIGLALMVFGFLAGTGKAAVAQVYWTSAASADQVQSAINQAANGDTVRCTEGGRWSSPVVIPASRGIVLDGQGVTIERDLPDQQAMLLISNHPTTTTRVTGFQFNEDAAESIPGYFISIGGGFQNAKFRIDHCQFVGNHLKTSIQVTQAWGLIDHCILSAHDNAEQIHNEAYGSADATGWSEEITPGSGDALYIEDNVFSNSHLYLSGDTIYFWGNSAVQSYYGARTVLRHNTLTMSQVDQHGSKGMIGARWWEIYDNEFRVVEDGNQSTFIALRGGSGVVFNNQAKCDGWAWGCGSIQLYEEDFESADYQVGRGKDQCMDPAYLWNNGSQISITGDAVPITVSENTDYFLIPKPDYTPYTYPHPLQITEGVPDSLGAGRVSVYPNPAKERATFQVRPWNGGGLRIAIFNVAGERVAEIRESLAAGQQAEAVWNCQAVGRGVYVALAYWNDVKFGECKMAVSR